MRADRTTDAPGIAIRAARASTEARFLDIGGRLEQSVETLEGLTRTFGGLSSELRGEALQQATSDLSQIGTKISAIAEAMGSELGAFGRLTDLAGSIEGRVARLRKSVKEVAMLATNAKIAAAHIGDHGEEFMSFTREIDRTLRVAQASLDEFAAELAQVSRHLRAAIATQAAIEEQQAGAVQSIRLRLGRTLDALSVRGRSAAEAAAAVGAATRRVAQRIGDAVMALQIGDITCQRIEHVLSALDLLGDVLDPVRQTAPEGQSAWPSLTPSQCRSLVGFCRGLQSAQLVDAADEFDQEVQRISISLQAIAADAAEILRLGKDAFGSSMVGECEGTFMRDLEHEVGDVDALLAGLRTSRRDADGIAAALSQVTTRLGVHMNTLRSLEADIRIMGLNTTLKCGRLGAAGRPLAIIAQELRLNANEIGVDAGEVMTTLDQIVVAAGAVSFRAEDGRAADIEAIADVMARSLSRLTEVGQSVAHAFGTLGRDGHAVTALLRETVARNQEHEEAGRALRQAAAVLVGDAPAVEYDFDDAPSQAGHLVELFARSYTMQRERAVFDRHVPARARRRDAAEAPAPEAAAAETEDVLF